MNAKKVLFPTDFSEASDAMLDYAIPLAKDAGATLLIVHVEEPQPSYIGDGYYGVPNPPNPEVRRMLQAIQPKDAELPYEHRLLFGDPVTEILRLAEDEQVALIVMGTHGRTGVSRLVMGSVAEAVVRRATCPVLTFKQPHPVAARVAK